MSDGNFNRKLIPSDQYQSGLRAGEARMRQRAIVAFRRWFKARHPKATDEEVHDAEKDFHEFVKLKIES